VVSSKGGHCSNCLATRRLCTTRMHKTTRMASLGPLDITGARCTAEWHALQACPKWCTSTYGHLKKARHRSQHNSGRHTHDMHNGIMPGEHVVRDGPLLAVAKILVLLHQSDRWERVWCCPRMPLAKATYTHARLAGSDRVGVVGLKRVPIGFFSTAVCVRDSPKRIRIRSRAPR
jgi:hypothetical protein